MKTRVSVCWLRVQDDMPAWLGVPPEKCVGRTTYLVMDLEGEWEAEAAKAEVMRWVREVGVKDYPGMVVGDFEKWVVGIVDC
jgi:hypothetical protein